jgi:hypothetical protein
MLTTTSRQTRYDFRHHWMLVNLAAAAWVATLMITGYYIFSALTVS